jgi:alanine dehydrogenase
LTIGRMGLGKALLADPGLAKGVDMHSGRVVKEAVCEAHNLKLERLEDHLR